MTELSVPERVFEELWSVFERRYAFFDVRNVDWKGQYERYRPAVTDSTTDDSLFALLSEMLTPLADEHVELERKGQVFCAGPESRFESEFSRSAAKRLFRVSYETLASHGFRDRIKVNKMLRMACSASCGYLRIREFDGVKKKRLLHDLDAVFSKFDGLRGLIIDVRDNPGGDDSVAYRIARRLTKERVVAHYKKTKKGAGESEYGELKTRYLKPRGEVGFTGPIALLTNDSTFSAAEVFALSLLPLDHVRMVGVPTYGILSDEYCGKLANGWSYTLSHQRYYSADMVCYEGVGVPVDIEVANTRADLDQHRDPVIEAALQVLAV